MGVDKGCLTSTRNTSSGCATRNAGGVWMSSIGLSCTSRSATKQPHLKINAPPPPRPPPLLLLLLLFLHPNATCSQRVLLAERRRRRSVAMFVQAHAFVLAEGDGQRPLCMVPRAQRPQLSTTLPQLSHTPARESFYVNPPDLSARLRTEHCNNNNKKKNNNTNDNNKKREY